MRLIYLCLVFFCCSQVPTLWGQRLIPLARNQTLQKLAGPENGRVIGLRNQNMPCDNVNSPGVVYLYASESYNTFIEIDTVGLDTLPGTYSCVDCDSLQFGQVAISDDLLTYTADANVVAGLDAFTVEFCNSNGCRSTGFAVIVRRRGQNFFPGAVSLNPGQRQQFEIPVDGFPRTNYLL